MIAVSNHLDSSQFMNGSLSNFVLRVLFRRAVSVVISAVYQVHTLRLIVHCKLERLTLQAQFIFLSFILLHFLCCYIAFFHAIFFSYFLFFLKAIIGALFSNRFCLRIVFQ